MQGLLYIPVDMQVYISNLINLVSIPCQLFPVIKKQTEMLKNIYVKD